VILSINNRAFCGYKTELARRSVSWWRDAMPWTAFALLHARFWPTAGLLAIRHKPTGMGGS
jgi:hypothetical protein